MQGGIRSIESRPITVSASKIRCVFRAGLIWDSKVWDGSKQEQEEHSELQLKLHSFSSTFESTSSWKQMQVIVNKLQWGSKIWITLWQKHPKTKLVVIQFSNGPIDRKLDFLSKFWMPFTFHIFRQFTLITFKSHNCEGWIYELVNPWQIGPTKTKPFHYLNNYVHQLEWLFCEVLHWPILKLKLFIFTLIWN